MQKFSNKNEYEMTIGNRRGFVRKKVSLSHNNYTRIIYLFFANIVIFLKRN
jgi:hypothetical protein